MRKFYLVFIYIIIFIGTIFISLAFCEVIARVFHLSRTYNSYSSCVNGKNALNYSPQKNSHGWRDREFTKDKKINTFRIACIGDSVTEGYRIALENIFPKTLERMLQKAGYEAEVMNLGKGGNATSDNLLAVGAVMEFNPDLIIFQFGMNDIKGFEHRELISTKNETFTSNILTKKSKRFNPRTLLRKSVLYLALAERYNYFKLSSGFKNWAFDEWDVKEEIWEKEFSRLKEGFSKVENRSGVLICYLPYDFQVYSAREEVFIPSSKIGKFCRDNNYRFVDFTRIFKSQRDTYSLFLDDAHLSVYGHKVVAEYLSGFILEKIIR